MLSTLQNLHLCYCSESDSLIQILVPEDNEALEHVRKGWSD